MAKTFASFESRPGYVIINSGLGNLMILLFALVTVMNSIAGEFESGAIVPLTKPILRTLVLMGKVIAALTTILAAYTLLYVLYVYMIIGGTIIYGPQDNLDIVPICMLADILSTFVWISFILAISSLSKNSSLNYLSLFSVRFRYGVP